MQLTQTHSPQTIRKEKRRRTREKRERDDIHTGGQTNEMKQHQQKGLIDDE